MSVSQPRIVLRISNDELRQSLLRSLAANGFSIASAGSAMGTNRFSDIESEVMLLETSDDVGFIVQIVHEFYEIFGYNRVLPIIAIVSRVAMDRNPSLRTWMIDGHPAIAKLLCREEATAERIIEILRETQR